MWNSAVGTAPSSRGSSNRLRNSSSGGSGSHYRYRSARSVKRQNQHPRHPQPLPSKWATLKLGLICCGASLLGLATLSPLFLMGNYDSSIPQNHNNIEQPQQPQNSQQHVGLSALLQNSKQLQQNYMQQVHLLRHQQTGSNGSSLAHEISNELFNVEKSIEGYAHQLLRARPNLQPLRHSYEDEEEMQKEVGGHVQHGHAFDDDEQSAAAEHEGKNHHDAESQSDSHTSHDQSLQQHGKQQYGQETTKESQSLPLARGVVGLPMSQTPALIGAQRGEIHCESNEDINYLAYWNEPQGTFDRQFKSPFAVADEGGDTDTKGGTKYLTFELDPGGWNNIRMNLENIFVFAATTGRTLVLPPDQPMYLLGFGAEGAKNVGTYFNMTRAKQVMNIISMEEFIQKEGPKLLELSHDEQTKLLPIAHLCTFKAGDNPQHCDHISKILRKKGMQPDMEAADHCLIFDKDVLQSGSNKTLSVDAQRRVSRFCQGRTINYYTQELTSPQLIHWDGNGLKYRLLNHFYAFMYFTDSSIDNHYKRFVRDILHYRENIFCVAGKIINALRKEVGSFSTLHIRRGDLQYKEVKLSAEDWYNNTKEVWNPNEVLYIATDERNKTWFDPLRKHHPVKFLDDYWSMAGLDSVDSSIIGMIDTIVAAQGRTYVGTWMSTFSGYINRLRGYQGMSMRDSYYSYLPRKTRMHKWTYFNGNLSPREWPIGWVGIDGEEVLEEEQDPQSQQLSNSNAIDKKSKQVGKNKALARGVAGLPLEQTPALEGASRAHIECDVDVDSLAYWNDPQGHRDAKFKSPFQVEGDAKYITFTPDRGGWNNIRMSMEIIFIFAAATGRTLVLPPDQNLYLLHHDKGKRQRGFADFFPLHKKEFQDRVKVITMSEFVKLEGAKNGPLAVPEKNRTIMTKVAEHCDKKKRMDNYCGILNDYLATVGHVPKLSSKDNCVVFDREVYHDKDMKNENKAAVKSFCKNQKVFNWDKEMRDPALLHFEAGEKETRLLAHFYGFVFFTDPAIDNFYKRFVRDFLHYHDAIFCAAGKIVQALQVEGTKRGFSPDAEGTGGYSALHIRRGDFQYKRVKLEAFVWYNHTKEIWTPKEILYIATDERNKSWFDPIAAHHDIRFLDDYWDMAGMDKLDPNYAGMVDTIVASRGRAFAGTWFSTFSGYINRMRGYHGVTMKDSWYSFLPKKRILHTWSNESKFVYSYEWPLGWIGIDGDKVQSKNKF